MEWIHATADHSTMLDEQWFLRRDNKTLCSLRRNGAHAWVATLLNLDGVGCSTLHTFATSLEQAKRECETVLRMEGGQDGK
jgi:hypothetical protein